ncbi:DUF1176 domain-containing protein [Phormidesmis sp. 146-12]
MPFNLIKVSSVLLATTLLFTSQTFAKSLAQKAETKLSPYQSRIVDRLQKCPYGSQPDALQRSSFLRVGNQKYIVQIMCNFGAYQGAYEYYLLSESAGQTQSKPLNLLKIGERGEKLVDNTLVGYPTYDSSKKELTVFTKSRGIGDCGSFGRYQFENDRFVAQEIRIKSECDGKYVEPEKYQKVYPSSR